MERPSPSSSRFRNNCQLLAQALLSAASTAESHAAVLRQAFAPAAIEAEVVALAFLAIKWTARRPPPRIRPLGLQLGEHEAVRRWFSKRRFVLPPVTAAPRMRRWQGTQGLPTLETIGELARWLGLDPGYLYWMADLQDRNRKGTEQALRHYLPRVHRKQDGSLRLVEMPKQLLRHVQRQVLHDLLDKVEPHEGAHGFRSGRSIRTFAEVHTGQALVLRFDLQNFFTSISGARVQTMFRTLGYPEHVADLLGGLCTTTTSSATLASLALADKEASSDTARELRERYGRPHLPQGAPTSPAVANLCALGLDRRLTGLATAAGAVYSRYADDLGFSGGLPFARRAKNFAERVAAVIAEEGFVLNHRKTRFMRAAGRQQLAGLVVNRTTNLRRADLEHLEAILTNCVRQGPQAQNRSGHPDFRAHLQGRVAFAAMVNARRGEQLRRLL